MTWQCPAITNGVAVFPDGKIRPCCQVSAEYSKPIEEINNPNRFIELTQVDRPEACKICWQAEDNGHSSIRNFYKRKFNPTVGDKLQFLDFRNSNQCNLKCRYCGPHFSNQWAKELNIVPSFKHADFWNFKDTLFVDTLTDMYWCGGEPLILKDHYDTCQLLVDNGISNRITLRYNTNLTILKYKNVQVFDIWKKFKAVNIDVSVDATGEAASYIRSGSDWTTIDKNINDILAGLMNNVTLRLTPVISLLNIWFLPELVEYARIKNIQITPYVLYGPDYLSLSALPPELKDLARSKVELIKGNIQCNEILHVLAQDKQELFNHALRHVLLLDSIRNEKLFQLLPFKQHAIDTTLRNFEYE